MKTYKEFIREGVNVKQATLDFIEKEFGKNNVTAKPTSLNDNEYLKVVVNYKGDKFDIYKGMGSGWTIYVNDTCVLNVNLLHSKIISEIKNFRR